MNIYTVHARINGVAVIKLIMEEGSGKLHGYQSFCIARPIYAPATYRCFDYKRAGWHSKYKSGVLP